MEDAIILLENDDVNELKEQGVTIIYISHRLEELFEICDRVTVLRDGKFVDTLNIEDPSKTLICCVGPIPMMKAISSWAESKGMKCLVSMEQRMACGAGICLCCIVKVKDDGPDGYKNVRCCKEGPVFNSQEVIF